MQPATDTIAAIATAPGQAGVGIVRVSGPRAMAIARTMLGFEPKPRYAHYGPFQDRQGELIDEGIAKCSEVAGLCASTVKGLGSLVGTRLKDQSALNDSATEVLLIGPTAQQVTAVGFDGAPISGELVPLMNRVCVTFEVLLVAQSE